MAGELYFFRLSVCFSRSLRGWRFPPRASRRSGEKDCPFSTLFPRLEFIFEQGWSDGLSGALLIGTAALSTRIPGALLAGLWISSKQYLIPFIFPWMCLYRQEKKRSLVCIATVIFLYLLPLCNDPQGYLWSTFGLQFLQPFRPDSLSYLFGPVYLLILGVIIWLLGLLTRIKTILNEHKLTPNAALELIFWLLWAFLSSTNKPSQIIILVSIY